MTHVCRERAQFLCMFQIGSGGKSHFILLLLSGRCACVNVYVWVCAGMRAGLYMPCC